MKYTRYERLLLEKAFFFVFVVVFSSLENYFGFRTTNVRVKTDHPSVLGGIKRFEYFQREVCIFLIIVHSICVVGLQKM